MQLLNLLKNFKKEILFLVRMRSLHFLGPENTFTHIASKKFEERTKDKLNLVPNSNISNVARSIFLSKNDLGVMAYHNSLVGLVQETLDLIYTYNLKVVDIQRLPISFSIGVSNKSTKSKSVYSHPKAISECSDWLSNNLTDYNPVFMSSTVSGIEKVISLNEGYVIANKDILKKKELYLLGEDIGNRNNGKKNFTDFYLVSKENDVDKIKDLSYLTMIAIVPPDDRYGLLVDILSQVRYYGLNNAKIHSRPILDKFIKPHFEHQMFYLEIEAHQKDESFIRCVDSLNYKLSKKSSEKDPVTILGCYKMPCIKNN